ETLPAGTPPSGRASGSSFAELEEHVVRRPDLLGPAVGDMDANARVGRRPEVPPVAVPVADLGDALEGRGLGAVRHPDDRLAGRGISKTELGTAVAVEAEPGQGSVRRHKLVGALRHLLEGSHVALGHGGGSVRAGLQQLGLVPAEVDLRYLVAVCTPLLA